jgi:hypothetical protein
MTTNEWLVIVLIVLAGIAVTAGLYRVVIWLFTYLFKSEQRTEDNSKRKNHDS